MVTQARESIAVEYVPRHVAVIMDGNGRWAEQRGLPRRKGHRRGVRPARTVVEYCAKAGIEYLTLFAFSSENWQRPKAEVHDLMFLFREALDREVAELDEQGVRLRFMGDIHRLDADLRRSMRAAETRTRDNAGLDLSVAVAYGGRSDLVSAARELARQAAAGELDAERIDEERFAAELEMAQVPDVDLLIRTGGDRRISNFVLWSLAYSELYFSDVFWPDFTAAELERAIDFYRCRQRRFGRTAQQLRAGSC